MQALKINAQLIVCSEYMDRERERFVGRGEYEAKFEIILGVRVELTHHRFHAPTEKLS